MYLLIFIVLSQLSIATSLNSYNTDFTIVGQKVVVDIILNFSSSESMDFLFKLPEDAQLIEVYLDNEKIVPDGKTATIPLAARTEQLKVSYVTESFLDIAGNGYFTADIKIPFDTSLAETKLTLPLGAILAKSVEEGTSAYPKPSKIETDGQQITITWVKNNAMEGESMPFFVIYKIDKNTAVYFLTAFIIILVVVLIFVLRFKRTVKKIIKKTSMEKHLKEDEQQIVNILKKRKGSCEQGTLRVITGFSKASLSRLLKELEDRKIIYKEKRGKKNVIFLRR